MQAQELVRKLMQKYEISEDNVLRHYDVTGKVCPVPFVGHGQADWERFKGGLTVYNTLEQVPDWAKPSIQKLLDAGALTGNEKGELELSRDLTRTLVILDRLGALEEKKEENQWQH